MRANREQQKSDRRWDAMFTHALALKLTTKHKTVAISNMG
jgi:hypothetical protein